MSATVSDFDLLTTEEAARLLGLSPSTLEIWRCTRRYHIPFIKVWHRVCYRRSDLLAWLQTRRVEAGSPTDD